MTTTAEKTEYKLEYETYLEEHNILKKDLPTSITTKSRAIHALIKRYERSPSEKMKNAITKSDINICDLILDWQEKDMPEDYVDNTPVIVVEQTPEEIIEETPVAEVVEETPIPEIKQVKTITEVKEETPPAKTQQQLDRDAMIAKMEKEIKETLEDGMITTSKLAKIIGREPDYSSQKVGNLMLKRTGMMTSKYKLVS